MKGGAAYSTPAPFSIARHTRSAHQDRFCHSKPISPRGAMMTAGARRRFGADFAIRSQIRQTHAVATCLDRTTTARFCRSKPIRPDALWLLTGLDQRGRRSIFAVRSQDPGGFAPAPVTRPGLFCHSNPIGANPQRKHVWPVSISLAAIHTPPSERPAD